MEKKYYKVSLNEDDNGFIWHKLLKFVIDRADFFEYTGGVTLGVTSRMDISSENNEFLKIIEQSGDEITRCMWNDINSIECSKQIECFYTTKKNYLRNYDDWEWVVARLKLEDPLTQKLFSFKQFLDLAISPDDNNTIELSDPAFYEGNLALMFCVHEDMSAFILLDKFEKEIFEQQGIRFESDLPVGRVTEPTRIITINGYS